MASLLGLGTKEGEEAAADLAPLTQPIPKGVEKIMEKMEAECNQTQIIIRYKQNKRSAIINLVVGVDYDISDDGQVQFCHDWIPPKGCTIGVRRTGETSDGKFDHTTWMPGAGKHNNFRPPSRS